MKIAIIADNFSESSLCLAKYVAEEGVEVDYYRFSGVSDNGIAFAFEYPKVKKVFLYHKVVNMKDVPELAPYFAGLPFRLHLLRHSSLYKKIPFLFDYSYKRIVNMLQSEGYDAINLVGGDRMAEFHQEPKMKNIIHSLHEVGIHGKEVLSSPVTDAIIRDKTPVLFFSEATRARFLQLEGAELCTTKAIPFGKFETTLLYDRKLKIETGLNINKPTFLFFGFIRPFKGLDLLEEAMKLLDRRKCDYNMIIAGSGDDPHLPYFNSQENCYVLNKVITNEELNAVFKMSHCVVMPYKSASQTGIAPTAFLFNKPIIATRVGALPDVVHHEENGLLIDANDSLALASSIERLIDNPVLLRKLSCGTKKYGEGDVFDWHRIAKETIKFASNLKNV